jgi:hypothetical protein
VRETEEGRKSERVRIYVWVGWMSNLGLLVGATWFGKRHTKMIVWVKMVMLVNCTKNLTLRQVNKVFTQIYFSIYNPLFFN